MTGKLTLLNKYYVTRYSPRVLWGRKKHNIAHNLSDKQLNEYDRGYKGITASISMQIGKTNMTHTHRQQGYTAVFSFILSLIFFWSNQPYSPNGSAERNLVQAAMRRVRMELLPGSEVKFISSPEVTWLTSAEISILISSKWRDMSACKIEEIHCNL